jgi:rhodanese-related sulfurtransferase
MTLQQLNQLQNTRFHVIDIRTPQEFAAGHAPRTVNIPYDLLMMYPESYLKKGEIYYLICAHGTLSHRASAVLRSYGFLVANVLNGYDLRCCCPY